MENQIYETRVIPFVKSEIKKGRKVIVDNLSREEIKTMSCQPRMLWENKEHVYMAEMPLTYKGNASIKWSLYYVFSELTKEEQDKYMSRSIVVQTTQPDVVIIYGEDSKRLFGKKKVKERR